jgi:hypothetical protein
MRRMAVSVTLIAVTLAMVASAGRALGTQVLVVPASSVVSPGEMVTIKIEVRDVVDLYGVDIGLTFDPANLEVQDADGDPGNGVQIADGSFLDPAQGYPVENTADNTTGEVRYVLTLMAPAPPASGSGVLARITFRARSPGSSTLDFTSVLLVSYSAEAIPVVPSGGLITVSGDTATPSLTVTTTATRTRTPTGVPSPTPTTTATRTRTPTGMPSPEHTATPTSTRTPTEVPSPTPTGEAIEVVVLEEAAGTLGWPAAVDAQPPLYKIQYTHSAGHTAEAWMWRYDRVEDAQAALIQQRAGLLAGGWNLEARLFHGYDAYRANRSLNPQMPALPINERRFDFQGSVWIVGAYAFDATPTYIAPDPETVAEAVYEAGRKHGLFGAGIPRAFLPLVLRAYRPFHVSPTPTATGSAMPSPTPSSTATGSVTPSPTPQYEQLLHNPSFETDEAWTILETDYPAAYSVSRARSGWRSMRLGIDTGHNAYSFSSVQQQVTIPAGVSEAELSFYYFPVGAQTDNDRIYFVVLRASDSQTLRSFFWTEPNQAWNLRTFDLLDYAGQPVLLRFGVKNDGLDGTTAVYLDDVALQVAGGG